VDRKVSVGVARSALRVGDVDRVRAASTFMAMSASMNCTPWNSRSPCRTACAPSRTAIAASWLLRDADALRADHRSGLWSRVFERGDEPVPSSPIIRIAGIRQSSK
jgi:hypothetical protein